MRQSFGFITGRAGWFCPCPSQFVVIGADVLIMPVLHPEALGNGADLAKAQVKMPGRLFAFIPSKPQNARPRPAFRLPWAGV